MIVGAIAALETFHRAVIVGIVDSGDDYKARAAERVTEKLSMADALTWFGGSTVKFSELVGHIAPFSSVTEIVAWLEMLINCNLRKELAAAVDPFDLRSKKENPVRIVSSVDDLLTGLAEAFRLRHIFAHEAASDLVVSAADCDRALTSVEQWAKAIDAVLWTTVRADLPLTGAEMRQHAGRDWRAARRELAVGLRMARAHARKAGAGSWLRRNQADWMRVTKEWFEGTYGRRQGTMWPNVYMRRFADAMRARAEELTGWAKSHA